MNALLGSIRAFACGSASHRSPRRQVSGCDFAASGPCHGAALVWHPARQGDRTTALGSCVAKRPCRGTSLASPRHAIISKVLYAGISADAAKWLRDREPAQGARQTQPTAHKRAGSPGTVDHLAPSAETDATGLAAGPDFLARVDALGDRPYHRPIDMKGT
jgi:hypothetical protein